MQIKASEDNLRNLCDNIECNSIRIMGVPEKKGSGKLFENKMTETFHTLGKEASGQRLKFPNEMSPNRNTLRHLIIKMVNNKDKES